jgi:hypothetical protein
MKPEEIKNEKLEQELSEEELEGATGGSANVNPDKKIIDGTSEFVDPTIRVVLKPQELIIMKPEDVKKEQELNEDELECATGGKEDIKHCEIHVEGDSIIP